MGRPKHEQRKSTTCRTVLNEMPNSAIAPHTPILISLTKSAAPPCSVFMLRVDDQMRGGAAWRRLMVALASLNIEN